MSFDRGKNYGKKIKEKNIKLNLIRSPMPHHRFFLRPARVYLPPRAASNALPSIYVVEPSGVRLSAGRVEVNG